MTGNLKLLINFVWKFLGTARFGNDHVAAIMGYSDLQWGNILITRVYFVEGLGHNLFSVGQSKDEAPKEIKTYLKKITVLLQAPVIIVRTDNEEAARTMLIFSRAPLFLWAEVIATACYTQNRSIIHCRFNKTPYELINGRKSDISFLHVFGALCYPKNDREDIGKLGAKGDIGFFIGYLDTSCTYRVYNWRTKKIMETMNVTFDELSAMAFEQRSSKPRLQGMTSGQISSEIDLTYASSTITTQQPTERELDLLRSLSLTKLERLAKSRQNQRDLPRNTLLDRVEVLAFKDIEMRWGRHRSAKEAYRFKDKDSEISVVKTNQGQRLRYQYFVKVYLDKVQDPRSQACKRIFKRIPKNTRLQDSRRHKK
ncbi:retrovirus-related pol polyprotein from transposon TNT 1-94 [Tanacetum coccineum]